MDLTRYLLDIPEEPYLFEGPEDVLEAMRLMGYQGEWWMKARPLTEAQWQERRANSTLAVRASDETDEVALREDGGRAWYYNFSKMILAARLPLPRKGGIEEFVVDKPSSKTAERLVKLHPQNGVLVWLQSTLREMQGAPEGVSEEVNEVADLSASASAEERTPDAPPGESTAEA